MDHPDYPLLQDALRISQNFLSSINEDIDPRRTAVTTPKGEVSSGPSPASPPGRGGCGGPRHPSRPSRVGERAFRLASPRVPCPAEESLQAPGAFKFRVLLIFMTIH